MVREVLLDEHFTVSRQPSLPQCELGDVGLAAVGDAHNARQERVVRDARTRILLGARGDKGCAGQACRVVHDRVGARTTEYNVGKALGGVRGRERILQVAVRVVRGDEDRDTDRDDDHDREELGPLAPHVPAQLPGKDTAHHSSSAASTGWSTRSSLAIVPECRRTTRSAMRAIAELCVTSKTVWCPSRARSRSAASTCRPVSRSKLPVGSSHSTSGGSFTNARAIATRCC